MYIMLLSQVDPTRRHPKARENSNLWSTTETGTVVTKFQVHIYIMIITILSSITVDVMYKNHVLQREAHHLCHRVWILAGSNSRRLKLCNHITTVKFLPCPLVTMKTGWASFFVSYAHNVSRSSQQVRTMLPRAWIVRKSSLVRWESDAVSALIYLTEKEPGGPQVFLLLLTESIKV